MRVGRGELLLGVSLLAVACANETNTRSSIDPGASDGGASRPSPMPTTSSAPGATAVPQPPTPSGGSSCSQTIDCPGTMSGPWCVEHFPIDPQLSPTFTGVWSDRSDDTWISGFFSSAPGSDQRTGMVFQWTGCAWVHGPLPSPLPALNGIWAAGPDDVWAVGDRGTAINWDGHYWSNAPVGADVGLSSVSGTSASDIWTSGGFHWDGLRWTQPFGGAKVVDVWAAAPNDVWGTLFGGFVSHFDGRAWTTMQAAEFAQFALFGIWAAPGEVWAVGEGNQIAHFSNGAWTQVQRPEGSFQGMLDVMKAGSDVWAVGQGVLHSTNGGPFVSDPDVPQVTYSGVWVSPTQVWVVGNEGTVIHRAR
jgi:hypothetical protein